MNAIGGYFELELRKGKEYHSGALALNTGRNAIEYVLKGRKYKGGLVPAYSCDSILEPFKKLGIPVEFYNINTNMLPDIDLTKIESSVCVLVINYFGLLERQIAELVKAHSNIIIDNSQAFFAQPVEGKDTVYSPRKFFGVPDGAYLYTDLPDDLELELDYSWDRCEHLLRRIDCSPEDGYEAYRRNQKALSFQPIRRMSELTRTLLRSIDYEYAKMKRQENFLFLHKELRSSNLLSSLIDSGEHDGPMVYPFLSQREGLREELIKKRIFVATYWIEVLNRGAQPNFASLLTKRLCALPIDQRYDNKIIYSLPSIIEPISKKESR
jgi:hypothetical protein